MAKSVYEMTVDLNALDHLGINRYSNIAAVLTGAVAKARELCGDRLHERRIFQEVCVAKRQRPLQLYGGIRVCRPTQSACLALRLSVDETSTTSRKISGEPIWDGPSKPTAKLAFRVGSP